MNAPSTTSDTILVVDDSRFIQVMLKDLFTEYNYRVMLASNGAQAVQMARQNPPQLVILDVAMPGMSGFETCKQLAAEERTRDIPIIFLTAHTTDADKLKGLTLGAVDYLAKPFKLEELLAKVSSQIRHARERTRRRLRLEVLEQEISRARRIQQSMLPEVMPYMPALDVYGRMHPAHDVGGDFFGFLEQEEDLTVCIGDVSGKGVPAALVMVMTRTFLHQQGAAVRPLNELLTGVNQVLFDGTEPGMFVTMQLLRWEGGAGRLSMAGAGHLPLMIYRAASGTTELLSTGGHVLGLHEQIEDIPAQTIELAPGDIALAYTDGATETRSPRERMFGEKRLAEALAGNATGSARACVEGIMAELLAFQQGADQHDDTTLVCLKCR